jgi:hypothetical protein
MRDNVRLMISILGRMLPYGARVSQQTTYEGIKDFFTRCRAEGFREHEELGVKTGGVQQTEETTAVSDDLSESIQQRGSEMASEIWSEKGKDGLKEDGKEANNEDEEKEKGNLVESIASFLLPRLPSPNTSQSDWQKGGSGGRVFPISEKSETEILRLSRANALLAYATFINPPVDNDVTMDDFDSDTNTGGRQQKKQVGATDTAAATAAADAVKFWLSRERSNSIRDILKQAHSRLDRKQNHDQ